jgi:TolA-binding protein
LIDKHPLDRRHLKEVLHRNEMSDTLLDARDWAKSHLEAVLIGALVLAALVFGTQFFLQGQRQKALEASKALGNAQRTFQQAANLSGAEAAQGYTQAYAAYQAVISTYDGTPQAKAAHLGLANSLLAQGKPQDAEREFAALDNGDAKDPVAGLAAVGRARCLELQGKAAEAQKAYEAALATYPDGPGAPEVQKRLAGLQKK